MATSLTWQYLPPWLQDPLIAGQISLVEAAEMWDHWLMQEVGHHPLPQRLWPVAQILHLLETETSETRH